MSEPKIFGIVECYSMQPTLMHVGGNYWCGSGKTVLIDRINEEQVHIEGDPYSYYVGYDSDNNRLFEYKKGSVNIHYDVSHP